MTNVVDLQICLLIDLTNTSNVLPALVAYSFLSQNLATFPIYMCLVLDRHAIATTSKLFT